MYVAADIESRVEELDDGFERLGSEDTPFTLRGGGDPQERAERIHADREPKDRRADESSNERVQRDVDAWKERIWKYDFPFVDTIPAEELVSRAETTAEAGKRLGFVSTVDTDADIHDPTVKGRFNPGTNAVEIDTDADDFLGYRMGATLAHEMGHAFHIGVSRLNEMAGFEREAEEVFETGGPREDAIKLSERLRGPIPETPTHFKSYRLTEAELFADVFASLVIEPEAANRVGPEAVGRVEGLLGELLPETV